VEGGIIKSKTRVFIRQKKCDETKELSYKKPALHLFRVQTSKNTHKPSDLTDQIPLTFL
jgi:hypothetical protein